MLRIKFAIAKETISYQGALSIPRFSVDIQGELQYTKYIDVSAVFSISKILFLNHYTGWCVCNGLKWNRIFFSNPSLKFFTMCTLFVQILIQGKVKDTDLVTREFYIWGPIIKVIIFQNTLEGQHTTMLCRNCIYNKNLN